MVLTWSLLDGGDQVAGAAIVAGLVPYWEAVSKASDALYWLGDRAQCHGTADELSAKLAIGTAFFLRLTGDNPVRVTALSRKALNIALALGDKRLRASALVSLGGASLMEVRAEAASPLFIEALTIAHACEDRLCESDALNNLAICADYAGEPIRAHAQYEASLAIARDSATIARPLVRCTTSPHWPKTQTTSIRRRGTSAKRSRSSNATARRGNS